VATVHARIASPLGELLLVAEVGPGSPGSGGRRAAPAALRGLYFPDHLRGPRIDPTWREDPGALAPHAATLLAYFADGRASLDLPLAVDGGPFVLAVWRALRTIPPGATVTYADLARRMGRPAATRAVGAAVARNPVSIVVPCHRVVGSDGSLTGYAGGIDRKAWLLGHEGVAVEVTRAGRARVVAARPAASSGPPIGRIGASRVR